MNSKSRRLIFIKLENELSQINAKINDAEYKLGIWKQERGELLTAIEDIKENICMTCRGSGEIIISLYQDESKYVQCARCKGMGVIE